jgi:hypothetical protein
MILERKDPGGAHVLLGDTPGHLLFLTEVVPGIEITPVQRLDDLKVLDRLQRPGAFVFTLPTEKVLAIAADTRLKGSIWAARPVAKRSAAARVLVRQAQAILGGPELSKEVIDAVGDLVVDQCGEDGPPQGMIWAATWALTDPEPPSATQDKWRHPWEGAWAWAAPVPMAARLNVMYRDLTTWVFAMAEDKKGLDRLGVSPSRVKWLERVRMPVSKVDAALVLLSAWRAKPDDGYATALQVGRIFET